MQRKLLLGLLLIPVVTVNAQEVTNQSTDTYQNIKLEAVELIEAKNTTTHITQADMERNNATNLWDALKGSPGIRLGYTGGNRDNAHVSIRGLSDNAVGLYLDDVPVATTWRQENDYSRVSVWDLESVDVSKGYSSTLLGTNGMAGIINLRSARPVKPLEVKAQYTNYFDRHFNDQGQAYGVSVGTRQDMYYAKVSFYQEQQQYFMLSSDFDPTKYQNSSKRDNSDFRDRKVSILVGTTPTENIDISLSYSNQDAKKSFPPDTESGSRRARWPKWQSDRLNLNANITLSESAYVKGVVYYDKHKDESRYNKTNSPLLDASFSGIYDDYAVGGRIEGGYLFNQQNKLALSLGYRIESHKKKNISVAGMANPGALVDNVKDSVTDLGLEYTFKPVERLTLVAGLAYTDIRTDRVNLDQTNKKLVGSKPSYDAFNWQLGAFYNLTPDHEIFATLARKTRMPTMRERYSNGKNTDPSNDDIKPEDAMHYELGYRGVFDNRIRLNGSLFMSHVKNLIDRDSKSFYRNIAGKYTFYGVEVGTEFAVNPQFTFGANLNYLGWNNKSEMEKLWNRSHFNGSMYAVYAPIHNLSIIGRLDGLSKWWDSDTRQLNGFTEVGVKVVYDLNKKLSLFGGVDNLTDKNYEYDYGYPAAGRTFYLGATVTF